MNRVPRPRTHAAVLLAALLVGLDARVARAQAGVWRDDYATARREATDRNKPLVIEFGSDDCLWCRKLEAVFREPAVATVLADRFVCLKLDGNRDVNLAQLLRVHSYPTVFIANPDGKILATVEGYVDAAKMLEHLNKAAPAMTAADWMVRDFQEAAKAIAISDYSRAIVLLKGVMQDGGDRTIQVKSRQVLGDLEQQAMIQLSLARTLNQRNRGQEAVDVLSDLLRSYAGTQAASDSATLLTALAAKPEVREGLRVRKARELLTAAKGEFESQQFLGCLERCELLVASFADLAEGEEAKKLANSIQDNPEYLAKACESLNHRTGGLYLALAESWMKKGQPEQAVICLERVIQTAPGSRQAELAQSRLAQVQQQRTSAYPKKD
jgi:thioredoxin-like negative regulator of GroEL